MGKTTKRGGDSAPRRLRKAVNRAIWNTESLSEGEKQKAFKRIKQEDPLEAARSLLRSEEIVISQEDRTKIAQAIIFLKANG